MHPTTDSLAQTAFTTQKPNEHVRVVNQLTAGLLRRSYCG